MAGAAAAKAAGAAQADAVPERQRARNAIFMAVDGMSIGTLSLADLHSRRTLGRSLHWLKLLSREGVRRALCYTSPLGGGVTDSAAASSAWSTGILVNNEAVNWTPHGDQPRPLLVRAKERGIATGLVTTTRITHATPAGFIANVPHRDMERDIAEQMVVRGLDLAMGGGAKYFGG